MITDTIVDILLNLAMAAFILYMGFVGWLFAANRKRYRVTCECGRRERTITLSSAKYAAEQHMLKCKGHAIVSPLPAADIAKAAE